MLYLFQLIFLRMGLMYSQMVTLGTPCPPFNLPGIDGTTYALDSFDDVEVLVIIVMCNHCPYVQAQWDRFVALQEEVQDMGVQLVGVNANDAGSYSEDSFEQMKAYAAQYRMNFPYLWDETQTFARALGAVCTPDIFVYDSNRSLVYRGRLDTASEHPEKVTTHDLKDAVIAIVRGESPGPDQQPSMGCSIKWKK